MMATSRVSSRASRGRYAGTRRFNNNTKLSNIVCIVLHRNKPFKNYSVLFKGRFNQYVTCVKYSFYCSPSSREEAKALILLYFNQITKGCGQEDCENDQCASSKRFKYDQISSDEAAAKAVHLFKNHSKLCEPNELESNHKVSKPSVVEKQEDLENDLPYSIPVQETGGRGSGSEVGVVYTKSGAELTVNAAKPGSSRQVGVIYTKSGAKPMNAGKPGKKI